MGAVNGNNQEPSYRLLCQYIQLFPDSLEEKNISKKKLARVLYAMMVVL